MSMHPDDTLLHDLLSDGLDSAAESRSLETLLAGARRTRRNRRAIRYSLGAIVALAVFAQIRPSLRHSGDLGTPSQSIVATAQQAESPASVSPTVSTLTDEELFALFPGRELALIGPPGNQRLIFLDGR